MLKPTGAPDDEQTVVMKAIAEHIEPIKATLGVDLITIDEDGYARLTAGPREVTVYPVYLPPDFKTGTYHLAVWRRVRGRHYVIEATNEQTHGRPVSPTELADAVAAVLHRADTRPLTRAESVSLTGEPWYIRAFHSLLPARGDH